MPTSFRPCHLATLLLMGLLSCLAGTLPLPVPLTAQSRPLAPEENDGRVLPLPESRFKGKIGRTVLESERPQYPQPVKAPAGAPNVVVVLLDDCGFGQFSPFGGGVPAPNLADLAARGLRYNRFHTTALCSPTRAALITGRNHHVCGTGVITEFATGYDGYTGLIPRSTATIGQILKQHGYSTAWFGKNHNTPEWETSAAGPFDRWPSGLGFDYFYGFLGSDSNQWSPVLFENSSPVTLPREPNYHLSTDLTNHAIQWVQKVKSIAPEKPYFLYFCPGATHAPHHAPRNWIDKFKGQFNDGWDKYREATFARQQKLGVVPADARLTPRPAGLPAWNSLNDAQRQVYARMMEVYAGYGAHADHELGRLFEAIRQLPDSDNTLIMCICGDNGGSPEGGLEGTLNSIAFFNFVDIPWQESEKHLDELGGPGWSNHFPSAWGWAMNTPFQWTKQVASHLGGIRNPLIVSWPKRIRQGGAIRSQFHHVIDIAPTILEAAGINEPTSVNGVGQRPMDGVSMVYSFESADAPERHKTQYFEIFANRALYHEGWMASCLAFEPWEVLREGFQVDQAPWELYHLQTDFSQSKNVAHIYPDKLRQLQEMWWMEAARNNVLPLNWQALGRFDPRERPNNMAARTSFTFHSGMIRLPEGTAPITKNRSFQITADVIIPQDGAEGMLITEGGVTGGYAFFLKNQHLTFSYNWLGLERTAVTSQIPLPPGPAKLSVTFDYEGWFGRGGIITLFINDQPAGEGRLMRNIPERYAASEGLDVGEDGGSAVDFNYELPFRFSGELKQVHVELGPLDEARLERQLLLEVFVTRLETELKQKLEQLANASGGNRDALSKQIEKLMTRLDAVNERLWSFLESRIKSVDAAHAHYRMATRASLGIPPQRSTAKALELQQLRDSLRQLLQGRLKSRVEGYNTQLKELEVRGSGASAELQNQIKVQTDDLKSKRDATLNRLKSATPQAR